MKSQLLAQTVNVGGTSIRGPLQGINNIGDIINKLLPFIMTFAGVILFFILIWGGYDFMMSQGSAEKMKSGKAKITAGIVGFFLLVASYLITRLISGIFNIGQGIL
ncbi:hypothetical protein A2334_03910 [Candidatus Roizmanbacteria bacterium RIFOXYB2_FULL_38_10]|uniref:Uncharacterized protein n=1 Tax=Candidatus Roizmanbacteria bacterium RIFOXYD1_FULL_38_12 TaxID=1802093 RepID=A0A1F7KZD3_9BACT|nr:MAG: hypothetical protein A3K47_00020 [Candidatus Roizmanbacteria bacterium RIFOXYA2_FULL_38_14]OGK63188.1 MAG: hypothetical protein A3K27_00020 [Candidatus Roizmanbacteria bacterium RIFOXYA1_FULL_37_12]OGK65034.1 MAG: hypothetical protein A3K38_00020 [Candidatus Roizmanbacteria bacterium RIFOXYB1_FULL_40_23]OGK68589.1 MAG: hypothetical protein A2334_03910 [Candidatus Roizmanbacteria bacterium RIFOXYB2_FULL_38_10]OGK69437.1 MAG: hypothetical protein A3K21_00020 [Candidatus Roizmanbacteria ba